MIMMMDGIRLLSFLLVLCGTVVMLSTFVSAGYLQCPEVHNVTGDLAFVDEAPLQPLIKVAGTAFPLSCCHGDRPHVNTSWYWWNSSAEAWCEMSASYPDCLMPDWRALGSNGQILEFVEPDSNIDSGRYMCNATDGTSTINRTFEVLVANCKSDQSRVKFQKPSDPQAHVGGTLEQNCEGDFGCYGAVANGSLAWWSYVDEEGLLHEIKPGRHGRYSVNVSVSLDETKKSAVLTIEKVSEEDFTRKFLCTLQMRNAPTEGFSISLIKTERKLIQWRYISVIVAVSCVAVILLVMSTVCRPLVKFQLKSAFSLLEKRSDQHSYDTMLVTWTQDDVERSLKKSLVARGYRVYTAEDVSPGQPVMKQVNDTDKCASVIFIISKEDLQEAKEHLLQFDTFFGVSTRAIFIPTEKMRKSDWEKISVADYRKVYTHIPKLCTVATWPSQQSRTPWAWLQHKIFWSQLQNLLPDTKRGRELSSTQPEEVCVVVQNEGVAAPQYDDNDDGSLHPLKAESGSGYGSICC